MMVPKFVYSKSYHFFRESKLWPCVLMLPFFKNIIIIMIIIFLLPT